MLTGPVGQLQVLRHCGTETAVLSTKSILSKERHNLPLQSTLAAQVPDALAAWDAVRTKNHDARTLRADKLQAFESDVYNTKGIIYLSSRKGGLVVSGESGTGFLIVSVLGSADLEAALRYDAVRAQGRRSEFVQGRASRAAPVVPLCRSTTTTS